MGVAHTDGVGVPYPVATNTKDAAGAAHIIPL